jgi:hypothetical protein
VSCQCSARVGLGGIRGVCCSISHGCYFGEAGRGCAQQVIIGGSDGRRLQVGLAPDGWQVVLAGGLLGAGIVED